MMPIATRAGQGFAGFLLAMACVLTGPALAGQTHVAVAANFTDAAGKIGSAFKAETGHEARFSFGSTGQLYAQITQEAPFEVFLAADTAHPDEALEKGFAVQGSGFTYAIGRIVLWSAEAGLVKDAETLKAGRFDRLAIANPDTAPYGAAAVEAMKGLGVHALLEPKIVRGNSIGQTYQFVDTGNAELGFVALSQVINSSKGSRWVVPSDLHTSIRQDAVLLKKGSDNEAARSFVAFLKGPTARAIIEAYGYGVESAN